MFGLAVWWWRYWEALLTSEEVFCLFLEGQKNVKKDASQRPYVSSFATLFMERDDFWSSVEPGLHSAGLRPILFLHLTLVLVEGAGYLLLELC